MRFWARLWAAMRGDPDPRFIDHMRKMRLEHEVHAQSIEIILRGQGGNVTLDPVWAGVYQKVATLRAQHEQLKKNFDELADLYKVQDQALREAQARISGGDWYGFDRKRGSC
jgi:hypothetical protein